MTPEQLAACVESACEAARRGAAELEKWRQRFVVREKGRFDLVTDADVESQKMIREFLSGRHPGHAFLGEEDGPQARQLGIDDPPTWIVDPLDGTTNYVHDCPLYCVSVGLHVRGQLVAGAVYDPSRDEMFAAGKGLGARLGERRLETSPCATLDEAMLATGFPADIRGHEYTLEWWNWFSLHARSLRRTGSTALNLAYVAAGRFDGYWGFDNKIWDVAAGVVLVREAGGRVSNIDGSAYDPSTPDAVASNGALHEVMLAAFRENPNA
jgi:myo-inositol-1(or 4)-monophosphatase